MKQEYTSAHTYKLNSNTLEVKILQFKIQIQYIRVVVAEIK
jgi:hypothetical protein